VAVPVVLASMAVITVVLDATNMAIVVVMVLATAEVILKLVVVPVPV